jgi:hypothetical protein
VDEQSNGTPATTPTPTPRGGKKPTKTETIESLRAELAEAEADEAEHREARATHEKAMRAAAKRVGELKTRLITFLK